MKSSELIRLGISRGRTMKLAFEAIARASRSGVKKSEIRSLVKQVAHAPDFFQEHEIFGELAKELLDHQRIAPRSLLRKSPAPYVIWGQDLDQNAVQQIENACMLPIAVRGALMPDAHLGYGLPIGGVLATRDAVIPYAVGVDIACRMKMTVLDLPPSDLDTREDRLLKVLQHETRFGIGATFKKRRAHGVMDEDWSFSAVTKQHKDKAWSQLGTSGSGNHFVEYGVLDVSPEGLEIPEGRYLALLSHSGSRGTGAKVADNYSKLARKLHPDLPKQMQYLAWLELSSHEGKEYWQAMELMGRYAAANHDLIHKHIARALGAEVLLDIENHHNFAWREQHDGKQVIVHRKGATPAGAGILGIIPGSMATHAFVVRGLGEDRSLGSASHGAGRKMSRKQAKARFKWSDIQQLLKERRVKVISAGLDEVPMAYKDIDQVMNAQQDLVDPVARFQPRLVKMAPAGERPED